MSTPIRHLCKACGQEKRASAFNRDHTKRNGLQSLCRDCHKARRPLYRAKDSARFAEWRIHNGPKRAAHRAVERALANGSLIRPTACIDCGKAKRLDSHHDDYARPLMVRWLCRSCHLAAHRALEGRP